jgi:SAM-dependent methyltransferase
MLRLLRRLRHMPIAPAFYTATDNISAFRRAFSRYLSGDGIEIGPLHQPLSLDGLPVTRIRYVDRYPVEQLREHYPELAGYKFVTPDVVDDGETLARFEPGSLDFIIANHFIEHARNPLGTLRRWVDCLRPGGTLYMAVPDMRRTFDRHRALTSLEHMIDDASATPDVLRQRDWQHYLDFAEQVDGKVAEEIEPRARHLQQTNYSIHFHTFLAGSMLSIVRHLQENGLPADLTAFADTPSTSHEFLFVLTKQAAV